MVDARLPGRACECGDRLKLGTKHAMRAHSAGDALADIAFDGVDD